MGDTVEEQKDKTTYLLELEDGSKKKITVPSNWKVTFGPLVVGKSIQPTTGGGVKKMPIALRFYEDEKQQRAVFTNVVAFRDLSISIREERVETKTKHGNLDIEGAKKNVTVRAEARSWIDPDKEEIDKTNLLESADFDM